MPIKIPDTLPAREILESENIFVMTEQRAFHQDIRPLHIVILNLMPIKETAETQILRLLGNTPLQVDIVFLRMKTHESKNTSSQHLTAFYQTVEEIAGRYFDGMVITGAPIEHLPFEAIGYWREFKEIMDWRRTHVTSTLYVCWAALAGLYHHFGVPKYVVKDKIFGVFSHRIEANVKLVRGFDDRFWAPHSRYAGVHSEDLARVPELDLVASSETAGVYLVATRDGRQIFVTGHPEYDLYSLAEEYRRDCERGLDTRLPQNYFPADEPTGSPRQTWRAHAHLLFANWLNYYVYQETPFDLAHGLGFPAESRLTGST